MNLYKFPAYEYCHWMNLYKFPAYEYCHWMNLYAMLCDLLNMVGMFTGLFKLQDLVKVPPTVPTEMYIRQATPGTYRQVLREIRQKEIYKLIVDTNPRHMQQFFRAVSSTNSNSYFACHNLNTIHRAKINHITFSL
jgi:hypothetical protein